MFYGTKFLFNFPSIIDAQLAENQRPKRNRSISMIRSERLGLEETWDIPISCLRAEHEVKLWSLKI